MKTAALACLLALCCAGCGQAGNQTTPNDRGAANAKSNHTTSPGTKADEPEGRPAADVQADIDAAKEVIRKREYADAPLVRTSAMAKNLRAGIDRGIDQGFDKLRPDLERLAGSLNADLPQSERVRLIVAKADELTGWDAKSSVPHAR